LQLVNVTVGAMGYLYRSERIALCGQFVFFRDFSLL